MPTLMFIKASLNIFSYANVSFAVFFTPQYV